MSKTTKTASDKPKAIVTIGWHRYLVNIDAVQDIVDIFSNAHEIEREYADGESYSYISGRATITVSTVNEPIEPAKRPKVEPEAVAEEVTNT